MTLRIHVEGAKELIARLTNLERMRRVQGAVKAGAIELQGRMQRAPIAEHLPNPSLRGSSEKAQRMRAGFFYHLNAGDIEVPYRRGLSPKSQKLEQSWTVRYYNLGWKAEIGTNVTYARYVQDRDKQYWMHAHSGWITAQTAVEVYGPKIEYYIRNALMQDVEGR